MDQMGRDVGRIMGCGTLVIIGLVLLVIWLLVK